MPSATTTATKPKSIFFEVNSFFAQLVEDLYEIPASVVLAQSFLESSGGQSQLAAQYNNYFGIKGKGDAGSVTLPTWEEIDGEKVKVDADFARYTSIAASYQDYGEFLKGRSRYKDVFGKDPYATVDAIAAAGYATDSQYSTKVKNIIDQYDLTQYDKSHAQPISDDYLSNMLNFMSDIQTDPDWKKKWGISTWDDFVPGADPVTVLTPDEVQQGKDYAEQQNKLSLGGSITRVVFIVLLVIVIIAIGLLSVYRTATKGE